MSKEVWHTLTRFDGCEIVLVAEKDNRVLAELQAITWLEGTWPHNGETWLRNGQFTIHELLFPINEKAVIKICIANENGPVLQICMEDISLYLPAQGDVFEFRANTVNSYDWVDDHWQLSFQNMS